MKKLAIVVDSSCGLTKDEVEKLGWYFIPIHIEIDNKLYDDGININSNNLFDIFGPNSDKAKTSSTKLGIVIDLIEKLQKEYENILIYPISMHLSGQFQALKVLEKDYSNLHIVKSLNISQLIVLELLEFEKKLNEGGNLQELLLSLDQPKKQSISLMPKYNDFLVKGGRLSPGAATLAKLFKIIPIIKFEEGKLLKEGKGRVFMKTVLNILKEKHDALVKNKHVKEFELILLHSNNSEIDFIEEEATKIYNQKPKILKIPSTVSIHTGPEAIVIITLPYKSNVLDKLY
ncbi:DegV family protein [Mycoplasma crocodyli]|uniref:Fatty acid-binding protein DegV-like protein n=1 Tax=Mycoplasma crocodyli (strain ATCC 51981 / MP145) TaxID=512564 RepID=D5E4P0_MYCCM|nr:DegV family protein [Mycoplasma crocodyli]ADE19771.1 fatty acid-binding protein DegV-like protein [Mycoplasma crocodyli MP145]